jgi:hypothetical protein
LEVGAAGDGDNQDHSFSAFRAARCPIHDILIHDILPIFSPITRNWNFCSIRAFRPKQGDSAEAARVMLAQRAIMPHSLDLLCLRRARRSEAHRTAAAAAARWLRPNGGPHPDIALFVGHQEGGRQRYAGVKSGAAPPN